MKLKLLSVLGVGAAVLLSASAFAADETPNTLTPEEKAAGWTLLFNGTNLDGWHNFKRTTIRPGWMVTNDSMGFLDPKQAGDIVSVAQFTWFELQLDYKVAPDCNSGIIYHATTNGGAMWASGPEFQLEDNVGAADPVRSGWLYALYEPPMDPATGKALDATKPVGEWNHIRLLISPEKCEHDMNGVKYFEYVLHSDDFNARVAKSKFGKMPFFCKSDTGSIGLQGDHPGSIFFRNVKIRPIAAK